MKSWDSGLGLGYVPRSFENTQECMALGFEKHFEVFGLEALGDVAVVTDSVKLKDLMLVCRRDG